VTLRGLGNILVAASVLLLAYLCKLAYSVHTGDVEAQRATMVLLAVFSFFLVVPGVAISLRFAAEGFTGSRPGGRALRNAISYALLAIGSLIVVGLALTASWPFDAWPALRPPQVPQQMSARTLDFVLNGEEALDKNSGLTWARCSIGQTWRPDGHCAGRVKAFGWQEAQQQAHAEWRLPTYEELHTLLDEPRSAASFLIDTDVFPDMDQATSTYWTSSGSETANSLGPVTMVVSFDGRFASRGGPSTRDAQWAVRLVRSGK
jgi:Protein of unknown function (DUF1566)